jgi:hypothetical protein
MSIAFTITQVPLPGYLLHEVVAGPTLLRFRACALITSAVWAHGFESTPAVERDQWRRLYLRELQRCAGEPLPDPVVCTRPLRRLEIRARSEQGQTPPRIS